MSDVSTSTLKAFYYLGDWYVRTIPSKRLFHSNLIHNVVTRGDIFAIRLKDSVLTIVPGTATVQHGEIVLEMEVPV